ncbi:putative eka-like protein, partial [Golovinomyces cichoracearum]
MIYERQDNSSQTQVERQSIKAGMSNFLDHQAKIFNQRFAEAKAILNAFCGTLDTITVSDPELRAALEQAVSGLQSQVQAILWGRPNKAATKLTVPPQQCERAQ